MSIHSEHARFSRFVTMSSSRINSASPWLGLLQIAFALLLGLAMVGPAMTGGSDLGDAAGSAFRQTLYLVVGLLILVGIRPLMQPSRMAVVPWPILVLLAYCAVTLLWSIAPAGGLRRLILTALIIWSIFAAASELGYSRTLGALRLVLALAVFGNIATALLLPGIGIHQANDVLDKNLIGDWCGFMMQKNITAAATAFAILAFLFGGGRLSPSLRYGVLAAATFLLFKTGSRTSMGACAGTAFIGFLFLAYRARFRTTLLLTSVLTLFAVRAVFGAIQVNKILYPSDPKLLSGRSDIWVPLLDFARDSHYLGAGFGSFWDVGAGSPIFRYAKGWVVTLGQGHNGYLDLLVTIGLPGLLLAIIVLFALPMMRLLASRAAEGQRGALVIAMIAFCITQNATETSLLDRDTIGEIMLMTALALLTLITRDAGPNWLRPYRRPAFVGFAAHAHRPAEPLPNARVA
ncbi:MAG: O-antigen ligase family protein [Sphingomonas sp.]